jgi:hypothetical protein
MKFCQGWPWSTILPISASQVARITGLNHLVWLGLFIFETGSCCVAQAGLKLRILCLSLPSAGITAVHQHTFRSLGKCKLIPHCYHWDGTIKKRKTRYWWLTPVILVTWEAEIKRTIVLGQPGSKKKKKKSSQNSISMDKVECGDMHLSSQLWQKYEIGDHYLHKLEQKVRPYL